jgi:hypothetical protein
VTTATTPGARSAREVSIERIVPFATAEPTT